MNRFAQLIITNEVNLGSRDLCLIYIKEDVEEKMTIIRPTKYGDWTLFDIQQVRSNIEKILKNFLHADKPEVLEFKAPFSESDDWVIDQGIFPRRGYAFYDRKVKY